MFRRRGNLSRQGQGDGKDGALAYLALQLQAAAVEADDVLDNLRWVISKYGHATLADFYDLAGVRALYENCKFGWTSLRGAKIVCTRNGYTIELPRATPLK